MIVSTATSNQKKTMMSDDLTHDGGGSNGYDLRALRAQIDDLEATRRELVMRIQKMRDEALANVRLIQRLQRDVLELATIREYLKELGPVHAACKELTGLVKTLVARAPSGDAAPAYKHAGDVADRVSRALDMLGQHGIAGCR